MVAAIRGWGIMSRKFAAIVAGCARAATFWQKPYRRALTQAEAACLLTPRLSVPTPKGPLVFEGTTIRALHDPAHLLTDEPETIQWLDGLAPGAMLWDIGANVGAYTLYAASRGLDVMAFEPSAATYATLMRNIHLNHLGARIKALCLAFDAHSHLDSLRMASADAGHSMHAFGRNETVQGTLNAPVVQWVLGYGVDDLIAQFALAAPQHIKLDVDSIEERILVGAVRTLASVQSVMVEIDGSTRESGGGAIRRLLEAAGLSEVEGFCPTARRNVLFRR
jgi:FkbM family methyltransferase